MLQSIRSTQKRFPVFVANRLAEIERHSHVSEWRHVPSKLNFADEVSSGLPAGTFVRSSRWLTGREFLLKSENEWSDQSETKLSPPDDSPLFERKVNVVTTLVSTEEAVVDPPMDQFVKYFSSWHKLKRAAAWWVRLADYIRQPAGVLSKKSVEIGVDELQEAELRLLKYDQRCNLPHLVAALTNGKNATAAVCPLVIRTLNPILNDSVVRIGDRLATAPLEYNQRHPIILCTESHITELIVKHYHETVGLSGVGHTFTALRARYWIHGGSAAVRGVLGKCLSCRRNFKPCEQQIMADLPAVQLSVVRPPFFHTGVDLFGPFLMKQGEVLLSATGAFSRA